MGAAGRSSMSSPPTVAKSSWETISASTTGVMVFIPSPESAPDLLPKPTALSFMGVWLKFVVVVLDVIVAAPPAAGSIFGIELRMYRVVAVVTMLLITQYMPRAAGTFSANHPTMKGRTLRMTFACACCGSSLLGVMRFIEMTWEMVRTTEPERSIVERRETVRVLAAPARGQDWLMKVNSKRGTVRT